MPRALGSILSTTVLLALGASARSSGFDTLGDALSNVSLSRKGITCGKGNSFASSRTSFRDGQPEIGHERVAEIVFDRRVYNSKSTITATHGYKPRRTDSAGNVSFGPFESEDSVYFRLIQSDPPHEFLIERSDGKISSVSYIGPNPRHYSLSSDILQLGLVAPQVRFDKGALDSKIAWNDNGSGQLHLTIGDAQVTLTFNLAYGGLISKAVTKVDGNVETVSIVRFQKVEGHWFPREVDLSFESPQSATNTKIQFDALSLVPNAKPFVQTLPAGTPADGMYTNSMYVIDDQGRPQFVVRKGGALARTDHWRGWLYILSLTAIFALSATVLVRSYLRKRGAM